MKKTSSLSSLGGIDKGRKGVRACVMPCWVVVQREEKREEEMTENDVIPLSSSLSLFRARN